MLAQALPGLSRYVYAKDIRVCTFAEVQGQREAVGRGPSPPGSGLGSLLLVLETASVGPAWGSCDTSDSPRASGLKGLRAEQERAGVLLLKAQGRRGGAGS